MTFLELTNLMQKQFEVLISTGKLFRSSITGEELWSIYLNSFLPEDNTIFRDPNSSTHNCTLCNNFIRRYGNIVAINDNLEIITLFDFDLPTDCKYYNSIKAISEEIKRNKIQDIFIETFKELNTMNYGKTNKTQSTYKLGLPFNDKQYNQDEVNKYGVVELGKVYRFHHFNINLPTAFVDKTDKSIATLIAPYRDAKNLFYKGLSRISLDTLELVRDLFISSALLVKEQHLWKVEEFIQYKKQYDNINESLKDNWLWKTSYDLKIALFANELIGTTCIELVEGKEINEVCKSFNYRVDPVNYQKAKAPITEKQKNEAIKNIQEAGYESSFNRRLAVISDININNILHRGEKNNEKQASIFDKVTVSKSTRHKRSEYKDIQKVSIETFMKDILPYSSSVSVFVENKFNDNFVALTTSVDKDCKLPFKWNNSFSWTYINNLVAKTNIKNSVKERGGIIDGVLRFSIMWAEGDESDNSDLDAWCILPNNSKIGYNTSFVKNKNNLRNMSGQLDVDIIRPNDRNNKNIVENIAFINLSEMQNGNYEFYVNMFANRGSKGFKAEIEFNGEIYYYECNSAWSGNKGVAIVNLNNGVFTITHHLPELNNSKKIWNIDTNEFHKCSLICLSPNYWSDNNVGRKEYLFMLNNCKPDISLRGFHAEHLNEELTKQPMRRFIDIFGNFHQIEPTDVKHCLAGIGFSSGISESILVKVEGTHKRVLEITF